MSVAFGSQGTTPSGTTASITGNNSVTPALPPSLANGDLVLIGVWNKADTATATTPTGWTLVGTAAGGTGTTGIGTGPVRITVFSRVKDAGWSTMPTINVFANSATAQAFRYTNATGLWRVAATSGVDVGVDTSWSITGASDPGIATGDFVISFNSIPTNVMSWSAESITATGITFGTMTERSEPSTTIGNDQGGCVWDRPVTSGNSSAAPVATATLSTSTGGTGPGMIVVISEATAIAGTDTSSIAASDASAFGSIAYDIDFNGGTNGATIAAGGNIDQVTGTPVYSSSPAAHGGMAMHAASGTLNTCVRRNIGFTGTHSGSLYLYSPGTQDTHSRFISFGNIANSTVVGNIRYRSNNKIAITDAATTDVATSLTSIPFTQWVRIDWEMDNSNTAAPIITVRIYLTAEAAVGSFDEEITATLTGTTNVFERTSYGIVGTAAVTTRDLYIDTIRVRDGLSWIGPFASSTPIAGTDTSSIAGADVSSTAVTVSTTDTSSITATDVSSTATSSSASDTSSITASDISSLLVTATPGTDTTSVAASDISSTNVFVSTTDTSSIAASDISSTASSLSRTDTSSIAGADVSATDVFVSTTDTSSIAGADVSALTILDTKSATDTSSVAASDVSSTDVSLAATDTSSITASDISALTKTVQGTDTSSIAASDTATLFKVIDSVDTSSIAAGDSASTSVFAVVDVFDTSSITATENTGFTRQIAGAESVAVTATEVSTTTDDFPGSDTSSISATESSDLVIFGTFIKAATDSVQLGGVESIDYSLSSDRSDTSSISASEVAQTAVTSSTSDNASLTAADESSIAKTLSANESVSLGTDDIADIIKFSFIAGVDSVSITASESKSIQTNIKGFKYYTGGAWHEAVVKIYIEGAWHELQINIREGSAWL